MTVGADAPAPGRTRRGVWAALVSIVVALIVGAGGGFLIGHSRGEDAGRASERNAASASVSAAAARRIAIEGALTLYDDLTRGSGCQAGQGDYNDISPGGQVTVTDGEKHLVGAATLDAGSKDPTSATGCVYPFTVTDVKPTDFLTFTVGQDRTGLTESAQEVARAGNKVTLKLGTDVGPALGHPGPSVAVSNDQAPAYCNAVTDTLDAAHQSVLRVLDNKLTAAQAEPDIGQATATVTDIAEDAHRRSQGLAEPLSTLEAAMVALDASAVKGSLPGAQLAAVASAVDGLAVACTSAGSSVAPSWNRR